MNIAEYWNEKTALLEKAFEGWQTREEIQIRKLVISKMMDIPENRITYYIRRNTWYSNFVLRDDSELDFVFIMKASTQEKLHNILEEYFYRKDYETLCKIKVTDISKGILRADVKKFDGKRKSDDMPITNIGKDAVCECIRELAENTTYKHLNKSDKAIVDIMEKIYFDPVELFNEYVEESIDSETYYSILMDQWKTANEMAAHISEQRNNMNNFYMSLMSILVGGILLSNQVMDSNLFMRTILYAAILIIGTVCCNKWIAQIENYGKLNGEKYHVINAIERKLPANVMLYEYLHTEKTARKSNAKISFSKQEKDIAKLFRFVIISVSALMLVSAWGEYIWTIIPK